jgi:hypothetical protein
VNRTWSDSPFRPVVGPEEVPVGRLLSEGDGESRQVHEIDGHPGWLAKLYRSPLSDASAATLQKLVYLPTVMSLPDQDVVDSRISWPVARIIEGGRVLGVVMAKAPDRFFARLKQFSGGYGDEAPLLLDWLVTTDDACAKRGIRPAAPEVRQRAMRELLAVGALFARHGIVYADWSYGNAFWEQGTGAAFVIDMDTCGIGSRAWIESHGWEDPLFPESRRRPLTLYSDRYKLAVLTVRCLTGERQDPLAAHRTLVGLTGETPLSELLGRALTARRPEDRPAPHELYAALGGAAGPGGPGVAESAGPGNVVGTVQVGRVSAGAPAASAPAPAPVSPEVGPAPGNVTGSVNLRGRVRPPAPAVVPQTVQPPPPPIPVPTPPTTPPAPSIPPAPSVPPTPQPSVQAPSPVPRRRKRRPVLRTALLVLVLYLIAHFALGWL